MSAFAIVTADTPTMSSREIAEMVGARHDSVRRAIERLAERGVITLPPLVEKPTDGRPAQEFTFSGEKGKRNSIIVIAQLSPEHTARLVDRWQELETGAALTPARMLDDPVALRAALLGYTEKVIALEAAKVELEHQVEQLEPMAEAYQRFANAEGLFGIQQAGRALGLGPNKFAERLRPRYLFYQDGVLTPRAEFVTRGIFQVKSHLVGETVRARTWITPKGIAYFGKKLGAQPSGTAH